MTASHGKEPPTNKVGYTPSLQKQLAGCDSIRTLDLTVHYRSSRMIAKRVPSTSGMAQNTLLPAPTPILQKTKGCDSLATLTLIFILSFHQGDTIETDKDYLWPIDGRTYTESGQYFAAYASQEGCDSIYTLVLRINGDFHRFPTIFNPSGTANPDLLAVAIGVTSG